jgi:hypothetical protein
MKLHALTTLLFFSAATLSTTGSRAQPQHKQHHRDVLVARAAKGDLEFAAAKRQAGPVVAAAPAPSSASSQAPSSSQVAPAGSAAPPTTNSAASGAGATATSSLSAGSSSVSGTGMTGSGSSQPTPVVPVPAGANGVPALSLISSGMPSGTPSPVVSTYAPGATPSFPGGPALPAQCKFLPFVSSPACSSACRSWCWILVVFSSADWPTQDKVPDTCESHFFWRAFSWPRDAEIFGAASDDVQTWMQELNGFDIPSWSPTADGSCAGDPAAAAEASTRGWWTCSRTTRDTDITACPKKLDWGVSFDDGPSPWSECSQHVFTVMFDF